MVAWSLVSKAGWGCVENADVTTLRKNEKKNDLEDDRRGSRDREERKEENKKNKAK